MGFKEQLAKYNKQTGGNTKKKDLLSETKEDIIKRQKTAQKKTAAKKAPVQTKQESQIVQGGSKEAAEALRPSGKKEESTASKLWSNLKTGVKKSLGMEHGETKNLFKEGSLADIQIGKANKYTKGMEDLMDIPGVSGMMFGAVEIGSGFGAAGKWISAKKLKSGLATPIGKLTTKTDDALDAAGMIQTNAKTSGIIRNIWNKLLTKQSTVSYTNPTTGVITTSSTSETSMMKPLAIVGATIYAAGWLSEKMLGGKNFANFLGKEEAAQGAGMAVYIAQQSDNYDQYLAARELQKAALADAKGSDLMPYKNVADGIDKYTEVTLAAGEIMDKIMLDKQTAEANGEGYEETEARIRANKELGEIAMRDDYERRAKEREARKRELEIKAREEDIAAYNADAEKDRAAELKQIQKQIDMYNKDAEEDRKKEEEDRIAMGEYWLAYDKLKQKMADDSRPSNLNFGIL